MNIEYAKEIANKYEELFVEQTSVGHATEYALDCRDLSEAEVCRLAEEYSLSIVHISSDDYDSRVELQLSDGSIKRYTYPIGVELTEGFNDNILVFDTQEELAEGIDSNDLADCLRLDSVPTKSDEEVYVFDLTYSAEQRLSVQPRYAMIRYGYGNDNIHVALL